MYTVRIYEVVGVEKPNLNLIQKEFATKLETNLAMFDITTKGVHVFLGREDHFTVHGFRKEGDNILQFKDWEVINKVINSILDDMKIKAIVKAPTYRIRNLEREF